MNKWITRLLWNTSRIFCACIQELFYLLYGDTTIPLIRYSLFFQTADWKTKMGSHVIFRSQKLYHFIQKYEIPNIKVGKKYNNFDIFDVIFQPHRLRLFSNWCRWNPKPSVRLEQDKVKYHWVVSILLNNSNLCKNKPQCKTQAFLLNSLVRNFSVTVFTKVWAISSKTCGKFPLTENFLTR